MRLKQHFREGKEMPLVQLLGDGWHFWLIFIWLGRCYFRAIILFLFFSTGNI